MILTDEQILSCLKEGKLGIDPHKASQVQPASYDLRVGNKAIATSSDGAVDVESKGFFALRPGDFGIILTREVLKFDDRHTARIGLRSRYARKGILATTGPQVDPGFEGRLKIGVTNLSPHTISFPFEDDFITLEIHELTKPAKNPYRGPYQGETELSADDIAAVTEGDNIGFAKMLDSLRALSQNVAELTETVNRLSLQIEAQQQQIKFIQQQIKFIMWGGGIGMAFLALVITTVGLMVGLKP